MPLAFYHYKDWLPCCCSCWPSALRQKESRVESKSEALCSWSGGGGNWQDRTSDSLIFSGADFMSPVLISPHIWKSTKILHGDDCSSWLTEIFMKLVETFWKNMYSIVCIPPSPKSYILTFRDYIFGAISQGQSLPVPRKCCLPGFSPHFAPNKT